MRWPSKRTASTTLPGSSAVHRSLCNSSCTPANRCNCAHWGSKAATKQPRWDECWRRKLKGLSKHGHFSGRVNLPALWTGLAESVRRGASVKSLRGVAGGFERLVDDPVRAEAFNRAMTANTWWVADAFARSKHDRRMPTGRGCWRRTRCPFDRAARSASELLGTVYDLPHAAAGASAALIAATVANRAEFVAGDFFESVPMGADGYLLEERSP